MGTCIHGRVDGCMDGRTDGRAGGWVDGCKRARVRACVRAGGREGGRDKRGNTITWVVLEQRVSTQLLFQSGPPDPGGLFQVVGIQFHVQVVAASQCTLIRVGLCHVYYRQ